MGGDEAKEDARASEVEHEFEMDDVDIVEESERAKANDTQTRSRQNRSDLRPKANSKLLLLLHPSSRLYHRVHGSSKLPFHSQYLHQAGVSDLTGSTIQIN